MKKYIISFLILSTLIQFFTGCSGSSDKNPVATVEEAGHEEKPNSVSITKAQAETIGLKTGKIEMKSLGNNIKVTGSLHLYPQDQAKLSTFVGGNVKTIYVREGDWVKKGQTLVVLEHPDFIQMQQELQQQVSQLDYLKREYERKKALYDEKVSSGREYQLAESEYRSIESSINALKSKLELLGLSVEKVLQGEIFSAIPIKSPINGYVSDIAISTGDYVPPQVSLFHVTDNSKIHADFRVYEKDIYKIHKGQKVYFTVANKPGELLEGKVDDIGKTFEDDPKSVHVHASISGSDQKNMLPGMYVEGRIVEQEKNLPVVPEEAIVSDGDESYIFIVSENGNEGHEKKGETNEERIFFERIAVVTGVKDAGFVEINPSRPLPDARVVIAGAYMLSSEMIKGELEHED
ncbi:MAG: efflux RND transporter periplasmic adaptor subunit [Cyclobacteriaceae bacterium]